MESTAATAASEPAQTQQYFAIAPTVRAAGSEDGIVLLDLAAGTYHSLNPVGSRVWQHLARGRSRSEVLGRLTDLFDAPSAKIEADVHALLSQLARLGMLVPSQERPAAAAAIAPPVAAMHPAAYPRSGPSRPSDAPAPSFGADAWWLARSLLAFAYMDVLTRLRRFPGVRRAVIAAQPLAPRPRSPLLWRIVAAVERAASFYYKRRWCLQRSAACAYLLRRSGFAVQWVLGAQILPFIAHAWVELDGEVVNDDPKLTAGFTVLDRI
jgi:hypothetical protein